MKKITLILKNLLAICAIVAGSIGFAHAQDAAAKQRASTIESKIKNKAFVFVAQNVQPTTGRFRQLTTYYDLKISSDTLQSSLPYFGRAYTAPLNPAEGGYTFTSKQFEYAVTPRKKGGWEVVSTPTDRHNGERFFLTVFENGNATLQVTSNNRQPITFNGFVKEQ